MPAVARTRQLLVAAGVVLVGLSMLGLIVSAALAPSEVGPCSIDIFGLQFPPDPQYCYRSIGEPLLYGVAILVLAAAVALRPGLVGPVAALSVLAALASVPAVLPDDQALGAPALLMSLFAVIPFVAFAPTGPAATARARGIWRAFLAGSAALFLLDTVGSGFMRPVEAGPQLAFLVVGLSVVVAGWFSGRLDARAAVPAST